MSEQLELQCCSHVVVDAAMSFRSMLTKSSDTDLNQSHWIYLKTIGPSHKTVGEKRRQDLSDGMNSNSS